MITNRLTFKYSRLKVNASVLPLFVALRPSNQVVIDVKEGVDVEKLLLIVTQWFENLTPVDSDV
jgi:hypothetical protein